MDKSCKSCAHQHKEGDRHTCRRYPPTISVIVMPRPAAVQKDLHTTMMVPSEEARIQFPVVRLEWWCGEFQPTVALTS